MFSIKLVFSKQLCGYYHYREWCRPVNAHPIFSLEQVFLDVRPCWETLGSGTFGSTGHGNKIQQEEFEWKPKQFLPSNWRWEVEGRKRKSLCVFCLLSSASHHLASLVRNSILIILNKLYLILIIVKKLESNKIKNKCNDTKIIWKYIIKNIKIWL